MTKSDGQNDGLMKTGTSRRSRTGRTGRGGTFPRVMILALLIIIAGGAALFWPRGGSIPTGIGENQTVVSTPAATAVRSGDVDINSEGTAELTPEKKEGAKATTEPAPAKPAETKIKESKTDPIPAKTETVTQTETKKPKPRSSAAAKPRAPRIEPSSQGTFAVQSGAFGNASNADKEASRLKAKGWDARVRAGDNSSGEMVFRVWIGYFASRQEAQTFINQNSRHLPGAIPVHR